MIYTNRNSVRAPFARVGAGVLFLFILMLHATDLQAQRITYQDLLGQRENPHIYIDDFILPANNPGKVSFVTAFRIDYKSLRFKKSSPSNASSRSRDKAASFQSSVSLNLELFTSEKGELLENIKKAKIQSLRPVDRTYWKGTVYADTYEQTQSSKHYLTGYLSVPVQPGYYKYMLQISDESTTGKPITRTRFVNVKSPSESQHTTFFYLDSLDREKQPNRASLANFGHNVNYGKDFHLLFRLPDNGADKYQLDIRRVSINDRDTTIKNRVLKQMVDREHMLESVTPSLGSDTSRLHLHFNYKSQTEGTYGLVHIPNSQFENGRYKVELINNETKNIIGDEIYQSRWINMPISLLNVGVSIRMLEFIVSQKQIDQMLKGTKEDRIEAFKNFWDKKDPTPNTAYNELMAEYYQRIDHSYEKFSTINQPGYQTDMGKIYIRRGPPDAIKRKFPSDKRAVETWTYEDKTYIFRATSGFGDFELVSEK